MATEPHELDAPKALCLLIILFVTIEMLVSRFAVVDLWRPSGGSPNRPGFFQSHRAFTTSRTIGFEYLS